MQPSGFLPYPAHMSTEQYRRRRDVTTAQQLKLLQESPEFAKFSRRHQKSGTSRLLLFLLIVCLAALCAKQSGVRAWIPRTAKQYAANGLPGKHTAKLLHAVKSLPLQPLEIFKPARAPDDNVDQVARPQSDLVDAHVQLSALRLQHDADAKHALEIEKQSEFQKLAIEQLNEELKQERQRVAAKSEQLNQAPTGTTGPQAPSDAAGRATLIYPALAMLMLATYAFLTAGNISMQRRLSQPLSREDKDKAGHSEEAVEAIPHGIQPGSPKTDTKYEELKAENLELQRAKTDLSKGFAVLRTEISRLLSEKDQLQKMVDNGRASAERFWSGSLERAAEECSALKAERDVVAAENKELQAELAQMEQLHMASNAESNSAPPSEISALMPRQENGNPVDLEAEEEEEAPDLSETAKYARRQGLLELSDRVAGMRLQLSAARGKARSSDANRSRRTENQAPSLTPNGPMQEQTENALLKQQCTGQRAAMEQLTNSLAELTQKQETADKAALSKAQELNWMTLLLEQKAYAYEQLVARVGQVEDAATRLLQSLENKTQPSTEELQDIRLCLANLSAASRDASQTLPKEMEDALMGEAIV